MRVTGAGSRLPLPCPDGTFYFDAIATCVPVDIASDPEFIKAIGPNVVCGFAPAVVRTAEDFQSLRYCNTITTSLVIDSNDADADFSALYDVRTIYGECMFNLCLCVICV